MISLMMSFVGRCLRAGRIHRHKLGLSHKLPTVCSLFEGSDSTKKRRCLLGFFLLCFTVGADDQMFIRKPGRDLVLAQVDHIARPNDRCVDDWGISFIVDISRTGDDHIQYVFNKDAAFS
jgi:hypothetical protein